ncbi:MAG: DUF3659 domain-containing protein [Deltaproteobacteria bacterium]|nr:DUF3659 domain-containing protein [Deltaproteobacteria bacterium]
MAQARRVPGRARPAIGAVAVVEDSSADGTFCSCCEPRNPLVMRPDFGQLSNDTPEWALCVLHEPDPTVYRNRGDGVFTQMSGYRLDAAGDLLDDQGNVIGRVSDGGFQRLNTVDDDDGPSGPASEGAASDSDPRPDGASRPATHHVDLSQDDFYGAR